MKKIALLATALLCFYTADGMHPNMMSSQSSPGTSPMITQSAVDRFQFNIQHFMAFERFKRDHSLPDNAGDCLTGIEEKFFNLFNKIKNYFSLEKRSKTFYEFLSPSAKLNLNDSIILKKSGKQYDAVSISFCFITYCNYYLKNSGNDCKVEMALSKSLNDELNEEILNDLSELASYLLSSELLFIPVTDGHRAKILDIFNAEELNVREIKLINFTTNMQSNEIVRREKTNLTRFKMLEVPVPMPCIVKQFMKTLPPKISIVRSSKECSIYDAFAYCAEVNDKANLKQHTLLALPGTAPYSDGGYFFDLNRTPIERFYFFYHEGSHAMSEPFNSVFQVLEHNSTEKCQITPTMRAASCIFNKINRDIKEKAKARFVSLIRFPNMPIQYGANGQKLLRNFHGNKSVRNVYRFIFENFNRSLPQVWDKPLDSLENVLDFLTSKCSILAGDDADKYLRKIFTNDREILQILGFRIFDGVLYVNKFSDFTLFNQLRLPIRTSHMGIFDETLHFDQILEECSDPELFMRLVCNYNDFLGYRFEINPDFAPALFSLHGVSMEKYLKDM